MGVGLLVKDRLFWSESGCCGVSAVILDKVWVFWSGRGCSWGGCVCSG